jgi:hypothetical protein
MALGGAALKLSERGGKTGTQAQCEGPLDVALDFASTGTLSAGGIIFLCRRSRVTPR